MAKGIVLNFDIKSFLVDSKSPIFDPHLGIDQILLMKKVTIPAKLLLRYWDGTKVKHCFTLA